MDLASENLTFSVFNQILFDWLHEYHILKAAVLKGWVLSQEV